MLKPGLGKGLDDLMRGDQVAGKSLPSRESPPPNPTFGRGMETLIRPESPPEAAQAPVARPLLPAWFFFASDLLLLAFTIAITFEAPRPFDFGTILFCAVSVCLGAILAILGLVQSARKPPTQ